MQAFLPPTPLHRQTGRLHSSYVQSRRPALRTPVASGVTPPTNSVNQDIQSSEASALTAAAATFLLKKAAQAYQHGGLKPRPVAVLQALLQLERVQKQYSYNAPLQDLKGQWRLIFSGDPRKKLQTMYFPVRAHQTFREGVFDNGVFLFDGCASFRVIGPMRFGKRNRMEFSVDRVVVRIGGFEWGKSGFDPEGDSLEGRSVKDLPFFSFFLIRDGLAAARGRSGGLALYARVPEEQHL